MKAVVAGSSPVSHPKIRSPNLTNFMEQAFWTVVTGSLVFVVGKVFDSLCIQPIISYRKVIGEITYQLVYFGQAYSSTHLAKEVYIDARDTFRKSASRLQTYFNSIEWLRLWFVPSRSEIDDATKCLIGLSNNIPPGKGEGILNVELVKKIRKDLRIKFYEE